MSEEKKDHQDSCCGTPAHSHGGSCGCGCGCGCGGGGNFKKFICGLLVGAFIFAAGMWYAKSSCYKEGGCHKGGSSSFMEKSKMCPVSGGGMMESKE